LGECHANQHVAQGGISGVFMTALEEKLEGMLQSRQKRFYQWSCVAGALPWAEAALVEYC